MIILIIIILIGVFCTATIISSALYFQLGFFARFFHDVLGWHTPDLNLEIDFDGCSMSATCRHCKKHIMQDSQGNWFTRDEDVR